MATIPQSLPWSWSRCFGLLVLVSRLQLHVLADVTHRTNVRCEVICNGEAAKVAQSHKSDCERGCRYFNIGLLTNTAGSMITLKLNPDLGTTNAQCHSACADAYPRDKLRRDACQLGCNKMMDTQAEAPSLHGWLVYSGASERSMVVFQPPETEDNDWVLLDPVSRPRHDYVAIVNADSFKLTETHVQTLPIDPANRRLDYRGQVRGATRSQFCPNSWMWTIPIFLLIALVWIQYGTTIRNVLILEEDEEVVIAADDGLDAEHHPLNGSEQKSRSDFTVTFGPSASFYATGHAPEILILDPPPKYDDQCFRVAGAGN